MDKLPFTVYDFFAYLASGVVVLAAIATAFVGSEPLDASLNLVQGLLLTIAAYICGHVVANLSGDLIERRIVRAGLSMPTGNLLRAKPKSKRLSHWFPGYYGSLPAATTARIQARAKSLGVEANGEALFFHCFQQMRRDTAVQSRLSTFLNLYGFCRNMALALVIAAFCLAVGSVVGSAQTGTVASGWWAVGCALAAVGMFYRYLKFLRQFSVELLTSYAEGAA